MPFFDPGVLRLLGYALLFLLVAPLFPFLYVVLAWRSDARGRAEGMGTFASLLYFRTASALLALAGAANLTYGWFSTTPQTPMLTRLSWGMLVGSAAFLVLHVVVFLILGIALTQVTHLAARNPALRMGVWLGLVIATLFATGLTYMLNLSTADRLPLAEVVGGGVLGVGIMAWHLWRRHPRLGRTFDEAPLGDEVRTPPHAPGGPRV